MTIGLRKIVALSLAFVLVFVSTFGSGAGIVYAGGEEGAFASGKTIANGEFDVDFERMDGFYPASFKYFMQNLELTVQFADGTTEYVKFWTPNNGGYDGTDYAFVAYGSKSFDQYFIRFYKEKDRLMKMTDQEITMGNFTAFVTRNEEVQPLKVFSGKILNPGNQPANGTSVFFSSNDQYRYEESWYPLDLKAGQKYVFHADDWNVNTDNMFAGIWYRDSIDNAVYNLDVGINQVYNDNAFNYSADTEETAYLVIGEIYKESTKHGTMSWQEKRTLKSVALAPAGSYAPWKNEMETLPLRLTYTDGTTVTEGSWTQREFDATGNYDYVSGYTMTTSNGDTFYLSKYVDGVWQAADHYGYFTPGSHNWRAFCAENQKIFDDASVTVTSPSASSLKLEAGYYEDFSVSKTKTAAYTCMSSKQETIQIVNLGTDALLSYVYFQPEGTTGWQYQQGQMVHGGRSVNIDLTPGWKQMIMISSENGNGSGTIGLYAPGETKSATIPSATLQQDDYGAWATLPIQFNFVGPDGKSAGSQTIANWSGQSGAKYAGIAETRYEETVFYQVFKDGKLVEVPFLTEEMIAVLNDQTDDNVKNLILLECGFEGGVEGLKLPAGTYTVKAYMHQPIDKWVIGTGTIKVIKAACKTHTWNAGNVTKKATTKANGSKTYTCTKCGETKKSSISRIKICSLSKSSYTYDGKVKNPTVTVKDANGKKISSKYYTVKKQTKRKLVGKHSYKITFKGIYSGTKTLTFTIRPKATSITKVSAAKKAATVKWKKVSSQASGYEIMLATNSKFTKGKKTVKVTNYKTISKKVTKLTAKKKYWVKIRAYKTVKENGKNVKYYSAWSKAKTVTTKR